MTDPDDAESLRDEISSLQYELESAESEVEEHGREISSLELRLKEMTEERDGLATRRDELLATIARIAQTVPLDDEVKSALEQRGAMLAEIGTLRSRVRMLEITNAHLHGRLDALLTRGPNFRCSVCALTFDTWDAWFGHTCKVAE